ncbi:uncharacterized protein LOC128674373 [Plodia interpunctella]|uniref:uncharacterized protein LOC128674373 n=1 Tax=Plodia interpunctella TaxID=58824 RepID=UPI0023684409|nr:uncharacterized protein LOC128674373 [Plodia interpunctella]
MLAKTLILILTSKLIIAQINGEFWWLSDNLPHVKHVEAPKIEDISEFDTDESAKIIFRDDDHEANTKISSITVGDKTNHQNEKWKIDTHFNEDKRIIYPDDKINPNIERTISKIKTDERQKIENVEKTKNTKAENQDEFKFYFPEDYLLSKNKGPDNINKIPMPNKNLQPIKDKMEFTNKVGTMTSENICSYMKKQECYRKNGVVYKQTNRIDSATHLDGQFICCIFPLIEEESSKLVFPSNKRQKRSKQSDSTNKQREVLVKRRYGISADNKKDTTPRIVSPDDGDEDYNTDPYWNIKNAKIKSTGHSTTITKHDCYEDEDYVVELPKPGLLGVYSDHSRPGWPVNDNRGQYGGNSYDDVYDDDLPGYSTIDPRRDTTTSKFPKRGKPLKLSTISEENYAPESHTISYQSNPDFQVLQGFKLINLSRTKNKFYSNSKRISTESVFEENSKESVFADTSTENRNKDFVSSNKQIFRNCGKVTGNFVSRNGKQLGNSDNGSHPWLGLVVLSKRRQFILCYATILHPRAALTAADCVYGRPSGELTLVAGLRDLRDRSSAQYRITGILLHPQYKPNELAHDLAILHWNVPLKLTTNVQPACLGEPKANSDCFIYGWGGYDQAIRYRSRWQRATVLTPQQCQARLVNQSTGQRLPSGAFCAEVQARGTVTGVGGALMCGQTAAGVAVWRHAVLVLLPVQGWPAQALDTLLGTR